MTILEKAIAAIDDSPLTQSQLHCWQLGKKRFPRRGKIETASADTLTSAEREALVNYRRNLVETTGEAFLGGDESYVEILKNIMPQKQLSPLELSACAAIVNANRPNMR